MSNGSSSVQVGSVEALNGLRIALGKFQEEARAVVTGADLQLRRCWHWLDREMPAFWESRIKRLEFELSEAKNALFRKQLQAQGTGHAAYDTAEKEIVRRLQRQLEESRAKVQVIRRWRTEFERAQQEYNARMRGLKDQAEGGIERHTELLTRMIEAIEAYSSTAVPKMINNPAGSTTPKNHPPADEVHES